MKPSIKYSLCGFLSGIGVMLLLGAQSPATRPVGTYQITGSGDYVILLNTTTGKFGSIHREQIGGFNRDKLDL